MNKGIFIGVLLFILGIIGFIISVCIWQQTNFGNLIPEQMFRITIPTITLILCGLEIVFTSFFLGILEIKTKKGK